MKNLFFVLTLIVSFTLSAQVQQSQQVVNIQQKNGTDWGALAQAQAAYYASKSSPTVEIIQPLEVDLSNFTHLAIVSIGAKKNKGRKAYKEFAEALSDAPFTIINPLEFDKKRFFKDYKFLKEEKNPNWLYLYYNVSISRPDEFRSLVIRDYQNNVIYHIKGINVPRRDILEGILFF